MKPKRDLSKLPLRYQRFGKYWRDTKTGKFIRDDKITNYLPLDAALIDAKHEAIAAKRYDLNY
jgi:hypothetical protein